MKISILQGHVSYKYIFFLGLEKSTVLHFEIPLPLNTLTVHVLKIQGFFREEERKEGIQILKAKVCSNVCEGAVQKRDEFLRSGCRSQNAMCLHVFLGIVTKAIRNQALSVMYVRCEIYRTWCFNKDSGKRQRRVANATPCIKMVITRESVFQGRT